MVDSLSWKRFEAEGRRWISRLVRSDLETFIICTLGPVAGKNDYRETIMAKRTWKPVEILVGPPGAEKLSEEEY